MYVYMSLYSTYNTPRFDFSKKTFEKGIKIYVHNLAYDNVIFFFFCNVSQANLKFLGLKTPTASSSKYST